MDHELFIKNYLQPSADGLDRSYTLPLPEISGLKPCGEFIVHGHLDDTFSTNIIAKFESDAGFRRGGGLQKHRRPEAGNISSPGGYDVAG